MTTSKHTPGPWTMDNRLVIDSNGDAVAMVNIARAVHDAHCDARLIAAAPDLYAALQQIEASANIVARLPTCGERATLEGIARLAYRALTRVDA